MPVEVTWLGRNCFRLKGREGTVITDPCPPASGYRLQKPTGDVVTLSRADDPGYSYIAGLGGEPFCLDAPGEFEIGGVLITGTANKRPDGIRNIIFVAELDGIRVGHLGLPGGPLGQVELEALKDVDILLMPVGGGNSIGGPLAQDIMTTIDPKVVIPMNYKTDVEKMDLDPLERFLKETGSKTEPLPKVSYTRTQLPQDLTLVVLQPRP